MGSAGVVSIDVYVRTMRVCRKVAMALEFDEEEVVGEKVAGPSVL